MSVPGQNEVQVNLSEVAGAQPAAAGDQGQPNGDGEKLYGGKFKTVEELEAAYLEATKPQEEPKPADDGKGATKDDLTISEDDARDALASAGLNLDDFAQEITEKGALSEDSYKKLADAGYPKQIVDVYVRGLQAQQADYEAAVFSPAGGREQYMELVKWAKANLNEDQKRAFNEAVTSGDAGRAALAVQGLVALRGGSGRLLNGKTAPNADAGPAPFRSLAEVVAAQRDPRYRRDPAYRKDVEARLRVSEFLK